MVLKLMLLINVSGVTSSYVHKSINATVNIFIFTFSYLFNSIDFDSPGVLVKNKNISQLHSISLLKCLLNLLNVSEHVQTQQD